MGRNFKFVESSSPKHSEMRLHKGDLRETIGNPKLDIPDFEAIAKIAKEPAYLLLSTTRLLLVLFSHFHLAQISLFYLLQSILAVMVQPLAA